MFSGVDFSTLLRELSHKRVSLCTMMYNWTITTTSIHRDASCAQNDKLMAKVTSENGHAGINLRNWRLPPKNWCKHFVWQAPNLFWVYKHSTFVMMNSSDILPVCNPRLHFLLLYSSQVLLGSWFLCWCTLSKCKQCVLTQETGSTFHKKYGHIWTVSHC